jgi:hypothetical protein
MLQRERSHLKKGELLRRAKMKLVGHLNYYGIMDNWDMCNSFRIEVARLVPLAEPAKSETELRLGAV